MSYLYGNSTQSNLDTNYIEFLRNAMDLMVAVIISDNRAKTTKGTAVTSRAKAEKDLEQLHEFANRVNKMLEEATADAHITGPTGRCAQEIRNKSTESIRSGATQIKGALSSELTRLEAQMKSDRTSCTKAIETFLLKHDLPGSVHRFELRLDGDIYRARLSGSSKEALSWVVDLGVPTDNLFSSALRVDRLVDSLEIKVPEMSGFVRKSRRLHTRKLTGKYITGLVHTSAESTIKLRVSPSDDSGFDLVIKGHRIQLLFQGKDAQGITEAFDPDPEDTAKLLDFVEKTFKAANEVRKNRVKLVDARIDSKILSDHDNPGILVQRLIARIAPTVQEIARHSLSPTELVLKRVLADHRREEIFVSKSELLAKIEIVPAEARAVFAPLGLGNLEDGAVKAHNPGQRSKPSMAPPPAPSAFNTAAVTRPPVGDDEPTAIVDSKANGTITISADAADGADPRRAVPPLPARPPAPPAGKKKKKTGSTQPGVPVPVPPGDASSDKIDVNIDAALAALESETG